MSHEREKPNLDKGTMRINTIITGELARWLLDWRARAQMAMRAREIIGLVVLIVIVSGGVFSYMDYQEKKRQREAYEAWLQKIEAKQQTWDARARRNPIKVLISKSTCFIQL